MSRARGESGKRFVVFNRADAYSDLPVTVPCGRCTGCRLERSRQWAMRCMHEASLYDENCFITLTYSDEYLPANGSLVKSDFQRFMKRLRFEFKDRRIRYYQCGEYGEVNQRPHYHACLFGFDFPDKEKWNVRNGIPVFRSAVLERLWPFGLSEIGTVTFESAAYVARYVMKKFVHKDAEKVKAFYGGREPEYSTMSRRPGIGTNWFKRFGDEVYRADSVIVGGREVKPPKFYDALFEAASPERMRALKGKRKRSVVEDEKRGKRLYAKQECLEGQLKLHRKDGM